jgi:hypothetical protein
VVVGVHERKEGVVKQALSMETRPHGCPAADRQIDAIVGHRWRFSSAEVPTISNLVQCLVELR